MTKETNKTQSIWDLFYADPNYTAIAPYTDCIAMLARNFNRNGSGKKILEVGCGVAQNLLFAKWSMNFDVYGVDYSAKAIKTAKNSFKNRNLDFKHLAEGNVKNLSFDDDYFDAVIERAVLQLNTLQDSLKMLSEMVRVLKPGGSLSCFLLAENISVYGVGDYLGDGDFFNPDNDGIRHFFSRKDIYEAFKNLEVKKLYLNTRQDLLNRGLTTQNYYVVEATKPLR